MFVLINLHLRAQYCDTTSFQKIFYNNGIQDAIIKNIFFNVNGNVFIVGSTESAKNYSKDVWIMKTTPGGNVLWSKTIGMEKDEAILGAKNTDDGGFIIVGTTNSVSTFNQGWIVKTDSNANVQWSVIFGAQYSTASQVTELDNGGFVISGVLYTDFAGDSSGGIKSVKTSTNVILKLDKNGKLIWQKSFRYNNLEGLRTVFQMKDGSLMATGTISGVNDGYVIKFNEQNGDIIWMNQYKGFNQYSFPSASEQPDKTIHLHIGNRTFFLTADGKFFNGVEINLNSPTLNLNNVQVIHFGALSKGAELYGANLYPQHSPIIFSVKNDSTVLWAHQYEQNPDNLQRIVNTRITKSNIYLSGVYVPQNSSKQNFTYIIKADSNGSTLCSDTFNVSFKINQIPHPPDFTHSWINEGSLHPQFVSPYTEILNGNMKDDCEIQNCCKAVLKDTSITMCANNSYRLPPNDSLVRTSGLYKFRYFTSIGGCDSVLQYNVNFQQLFKFSLGNDTCLLNNQPVTFSLPKDSSVIYRWQNSSSANTFTATTPGKYWVTSTSSCNIYRDTVNVNAVCMLPVFVPSAFTPNGDGLNDVFKLAELNGQRLISLLVYNRYGENIYKEEGVNKGWDGKYKGIPQPSGTYVYLIRYFDLQGIVHTLNGTIVLIR